MFLILHPWAATVRDWFALVALVILFAAVIVPVNRPLWLRFGLIAVLTFLGAVALLSAPASAADALPTTTTFSLAPLLPVLTPLALAVLAGVIKWAIGDVAALAAKYLHVKIGQANQDAAAGYLDTLAAAAVGKAEGNLATAAFTDNHPVVDGIAKQAIAEVPNLITKAGWTTQQVTNETLAALGRAQIQMTRVAAPAAAPAKAS
jgi:hypothetical protein